MFLIDRVILVGGILLLIGIVSRKFSARFGVPVLVLFLLVGMLAGSEGIGGIAFDDYRVAHAIGTVALVVILFDGGLRTPLASIRRVWKPALTLATVGVLLTAAITGFAATWIFGLSLLEGLLLASIIASTDAAAVFSILRTSGVRLDDSLQSTLEIESGSNDPMAIFLTVGLIEVLLEERSLGLGLVSMFVLQMGVGAVVGYAVGRASAALINRINLDAAGLYPVLVLTLGLLAYGLTIPLGGSGYLAVYVAGIVIGNSSLVFRRGTFLFHDGMAWVSQITMFIVLGLLSFPSQLLPFVGRGLAVAAVLMFVARPLAVLVSLAPFRFSGRELLFISWVGLKGAVPVILATFPLLFGVPNGPSFFNAVFFVVLVSALIQGGSIPAAARFLGLQQPEEPESPVTLDITSLRHVDADIADYEISETSAAAHLRVNELTLPEEAVIAMVTRGSDIIPARGATVLLPGDHAFVIMRPHIHRQVDAVFRPKEHEVPLRAGIFLPASVSLRDIEELYGVELNGNANESLGDFMRRQLHQPLREGAFVEHEGARLYVHAVTGDAGPIIGIEATH